ncbi:oligosaccharide flippase family protein [Alkalimonas amylolytica]|uniref:Membrane protein involved in the export of O-antigen and teichoic acid n=1 Tax=Alkalimonas amylolytica TaxID=152573 RepID=A0A1H4CCG3_ALKAM|nr:oligosaccharide flippase family protein [Alkalimonas amylolytica]SEA58066.1 Membrane protein involved in the export of O-antigen and teichoic acid [Alkalimonas amylolytica]
MSKVKKAIINASITSVLLQAIALCSAMVIARLLTPDEIGTYAVVAALVMILSEFKALGAGVYLVRAEQIDKAKVRSALGLTMLMSWLLAAAILLLALPIARYYRIEEAPLLLLILTSTFIITPYVSIPYALLVRAMAFAELRNIKLLSALASFIATLGFILLGYSFYALALGYALGFAMQLVLLNTLYRPQEMHNRPQFRQMTGIASLGLITTGAEFMRRAGQVMPDLVIGRMGTTFEVGIFSRGQGFVQFLSDGLRMGVGIVSLPYIAEIKRTGGDLAAAYLRGSALFNALAWPVLAVAAVTSLPVIRLLFGDQWDAAAPIASILMVWAGLKTLHFQFHSFMIALGRPYFTLWRESGNALAILLACILLYSQGLQAMALGFVAVAMMEACILVWLIRVLLALSLRQLLKTVLQNGAMTLLCLLPVWLFQQLYDFQQGQPLLIVGTIALLMPFWWLLWLKLLRHPLFGQLFSKNAIAVP